MPGAIQGSRNFSYGPTATKPTCERCGRDVPAESAKRRKVLTCTDCKGDKGYIKLRLEKG